MAPNFGHHSKGFRHNLERVSDVSLTRFSISCFKSVTKWRRLTSEGNFSLKITQAEVQTVMDTVATSAAPRLSSKQLKFYLQE
jgi:hypothetical protein